jgi:hypothetical protein
MFRRWQLVLASAAVLYAANEPWKDKKVPDWTEDDAKLVMTTSPWAKAVTPDFVRQTNTTARPGMGRRGGGIGGISLPGGGMGRPGGGRGGYPGGRGGGQPRSSGDSQTPPSLTLRWESALPMREAELKAKDTSAPTIDESHYAIAVYGIPRRMISDDSKNATNELKKHAAIKRTGKKDFKPSSVMIMQQENGPVVVYLFPRSTEITKADVRVDFEVEIGRLKIGETFFTEDMVYDGKLEL